MCGSGSGAADLLGRLAALVLAHVALQLGRLEYRFEPVTHDGLCKGAGHEAGDEADMRHVLAREQQQRRVSL